MYVQRINGAIAGAFNWPQPGYAEEWLADDNSELVAFLAPKESSIAAAKALDDRRADDLAATGTLDERVAALELRLKTLGG